MQRSRHDFGNPEHPDLASEVAAVTGSSRPIGAATRPMLAANGRDEAAVRETVGAVRSDGMT